MLKVKLMDFHLDGLLNLPDITIERCIKNDTKTILKVSFLTDYATCPHCQQSRDELHQIRPILIRDLPISGQLIELEPTFRRCGSDFFICCENLEAKRFWAEIMQF